MPCWGYEDKLNRVHVFKELTEKDTQMDNLMCVSIMERHMERMLEEGQRSRIHIKHSLLPNPILGHRQNIRRIYSKSLTNGILPSWLAGT